MKYLIALLVLFVFATQDIALAAPKKKIAAKAKPRAAIAGKVSKTSVKKSRMPASAKKSKVQPQKRVANKSASNVNSAKKNTRKPAANPIQKPKPTATEGSQVARLPSGMAGLGITGGAVNASKALEIRGQARTLSMMLILRNGKENVNFVKVRQDYATEIAKTEF